MNYAKYIIVQDGVFADGKGTPCCQIFKLRAPGVYTAVSNGDDVEIHVLQEQFGAFCNSPVPLAVAQQKLDVLNQLE